MRFNLGVSFASGGATSAVAALFFTITQHSYAPWMVPTLFWCLAYAFRNVEVRIYHR